MVLAHMLVRFPAPVRKFGHGGASYPHPRTAGNKNEDLLSHRATNQKLHMDTLLKLCAEKKRSNALETKIEELTQQLAEVREVQEKGAVDRQASKEAIAAKEVAENLVVVVNEEIQNLKTSHDHAILARIHEIKNLKMQLFSAQKKANDLEYERDGAIACLRQLQSGQ